jgi:hypothetical protein
MRMKVRVVRLASALFVVAMIAFAAKWRSSQPQWVGRAAAPAIPTTVVHLPAGTAKLQVDETRHNFGILDFGQPEEHSFTIRNAGDGVLKLQRGKSSCQCTTAEIEQTEVPPGGETRVRLTWQPPKPAEVFAQGVTIETNDPQRPSLYLNVVGSVRTHLAATQDAVLFNNVARDETATHSVIVYSQAWESLTIEADCDDPHFAASLRPCDAEVLEKLEARCGCEVTVTASPGLPLGDFKSSLRIKATGDRGEVRNLTLAIYGAIVGRVTVDGPGLQDDQTLLLKTIWRGQARQRTLAIFVRGEHEDLVVSAIECRPAFVKVQVGAREQVSPNLARYKLQIDIPADAPITHCLGKSAGELKLTTNHPDARPLRLALDFAILEQP